MNQKYESDLTRKEHFVQEWEKIKTLKGKAEYLWTYYRFILIILLVVILVLGSIITSVRNARKEIVLSMAIVDANYETDTESLKKEILKAFARIDDKYKNEKYNIQIDTSPRSIESMENEAKLTVVMSKVSDTDVLYVIKQYMKNLLKKIFSLIGKRFSIKIIKDMSHI